MLLKAVFRRVGRVKGSPPGGHRARGQLCGGFRALGLEGRWGVCPWGSERWPELGRGPWQELWVWKRGRRSWALLTCLPPSNLLPGPPTGQKSRGRKPQDTEVAASGLEQRGARRRMLRAKKRTISCTQSPMRKPGGRDVSLYLCTVTWTLTDASYFWNDMHTKATGGNIWEGDVAAFLRRNFTSCVYSSRSIHPPTSNRNWHL